MSANASLDSRATERLIQVLIVHDDGTETIAARCLPESLASAYIKYYSRGPGITRAIGREVFLAAESVAGDAAQEKAVWQEDRYRVRILHCGDYSQDCCAISRRMSLHEAAKLACDWKTLDDGYIDILPPTDPECQPIRNRGEPEAIATEQPAEAATEAA